MDWSVTQWQSSNMSGQLGLIPGNTKPVIMLQKIWSFWVVHKYLQTYSICICILSHLFFCDIYLSHLNYQYLGLLQVQLCLSKIILDSNSSNLNCEWPYLETAIVHIISYSEVWGSSLRPSPNSTVSLLRRKEAEPRVELPQDKEPKAWWPHGTRRAWAWAGVYLPTAGLS